MSVNDKINHYICSMSTIFDEITLDPYASLEPVIDMANAILVREKLVSIPLDSLMAKGIYTASVDKYNMTVVQNINGILCLRNKNAPTREYKIMNSGISAYQSGELIFQPVTVEYRTNFYFSQMITDFGYKLIHDIKSMRSTKRPLDIDPSILYIINSVISGIIDCSFDIRDDQCTDTDLIVKYLVGISPDNGLLYFDHINVYSKKQMFLKGKVKQYPLIKSAQCILAYTGFVDYSKRI